MPPALSPGIACSPEGFQYVLWRIASSTRTLPCITAEQKRESRRGKRLKLWGEGRGSEKTEHKIPSVLGWMAHFLAWREQLWIQFVALANCVPESLVGRGKKWQMAEKLYSGSGQGFADPCWEWLCLAEGHRLLYCVCVMLTITNTEWIVLHVAVFDCFPYYLTYNEKIPF